MMWWCECDDDDDDDEEEEEEDEDDDDDHGDYKCGATSGLGEHVKTTHDCEWWMVNIPPIYLCWRLRDSANGIVLPTLVTIKIWIQECFYQTHT